ncbi:hypothetical protein NYE24_07265 [Paenibacillus sp. FSL H7-0350]|uniref:hypothetical protein n=1 Tax=Paenibacillus sp. FSL H7-0350 TaxID=2975345 RepID=UPI003158B7B4
MLDKGILEVLFPGQEDAVAILEGEDRTSHYERVLKYGLSSGAFLFLDYKGEEDNEIVNYILDYEFERGIELATQGELEALGELEYEFLPDKIRETNRLLKNSNYALFVLPSLGDYYVLFISRLENKAVLTSAELLDDELVPPRERYIQYYTGTEV